MQVVVLKAGCFQLPICVVELEEQYGLVGEVYLAVALDAGLADEELHRLEHLEQV